MKKVLVIILALGLIGMLAVPAMADTDAYINIYATIDPVVSITVDGGTENMNFSLNPETYTEGTQQAQITLRSNYPYGNTLSASTSGNIWNGLAWGYYCPRLLFGGASLIDVYNYPSGSYTRYNTPAGSDQYDVTVALPGGEGSQEAYGVLPGSFTATIYLSVTPQ